MTYNYAFILNNGKNGMFGCRRRCQYCNWKRIDGFLPSHPNTMILDKIKDSRANITISGGGDPLFGDIDIAQSYVDEIIKRGLNPRIITREVRALKYLKHKEKISLSISFDKMMKGELLFEVSDLDLLAKFKEVEFTVVAPSYNNWTNLYKEIFDCAWMLSILGYKNAWITIRENLRSLKYMSRKMVRNVIDTAKTRAIYDRIRFLPAHVCLYENKYILSKMECFGNQEILSGSYITPDYVGIFDKLSKDKDCIIFGGAARWFYLSEFKCSSFKEGADYYSDIDVFVKESELDRITEFLKTKNMFLSSYKKFRRVYSHRFDLDFSVDINVINDIDTAKTIISESDLSIGRIAVYKGSSVFMDGFRDKDLFNMILRNVKHETKFLNLKRRAKSEAKLKTKLLKRGWKYSTKDKIKLWLQNLKSILTLKRNS